MLATLNPSSKCFDEHGGIQMASIRKRGTNSYLLTVELGYDAQGKRVIKDNPMNGVKKPKEKATREIEVYDEHEVQQLTNALEKEPLRFKVLVMLALITGMRRGELVGLEWKHVDLNEGIIHIKQSIPIAADGVPVIKTSKTKNSVRQISLPASMVDLLKKYRVHYLQEKMKLLDRWDEGNEEKREFVFSNPDGKPIYFSRPTKW